MHHHLSLRSKIIIMISVMAAMFLVALDQTIIATALGKIVEEFNAFDSLSWIVTAYLLTTTITVPIAGKMSDLFGRRVLLLIGVAIFTIGSFFSGTSENITQLIMWRALQGVGGGIITANAFTIIGDLFSARERGKWQGFIGAVFGLSSVVGPLLGGWLTDPHLIMGLTTNWRWTFWINVPIGIIAFIVIAIFSPALKHGNKPIVDYAGAALLTIALGTFVLAIDNTEQIFGDVLNATGLSLFGLRVIMYAIVAISTVLFIMVERRAKQPILPLEFFKNRNYMLIIGIISLFGAAFLGSILYLTQFNQQVFGASPTESGLMLLPMIAGIMTSSITSGQLISKTGRYKIFMQVGIVVATLMVALLATLTPESTYLYEAVIMVFLGLGLGVVMPVMTLAVQNEFDIHELGAATSSTQLFRSLGSTIGIAVFGALLTAGLNSNLAGVQNDAYVQQLSNSPQASKIGDVSNPNTLLNFNMPDIKNKISDGFENSINQSKIPQASKDHVEKQFYANQERFTDKITHAFSNSLSRLFQLSAILMAAAAVLVFMIRENKLKTASPEDMPK